MPTSPLLALPLELRNQIYEELLYPADHPRALTWPRRRFHRHSILDRFVNRDMNREFPHKDESITSENPATGKDDANEEDETEHNQNVDYDSHDDCSCYSREQFGYYPHGCGWDRPHFAFDIHSTILRVNKQTYAEAVSLLYKNVSCHISLSGIPQHGHGHGSRWLTQSFHQNYPRDHQPPHDDIPPMASWVWDYWVGPDAHRDMNPACLTRMPEINMTFSWSDIFCQPLCTQWLYRSLKYSLLATPKPFQFTEEGDFLLQLLQYFNDNSEPAAPNPKRIRISMMDGGSIDFLVARLQDPSMLSVPSPLKGLSIRSVLQGLKELISLLRNLQETHLVTVEEDYWTDEENRSQRKHIVREIDLESLAWIKTYAPSTISQACEPASTPYPSTPVSPSVDYLVPRSRGTSLIGRSTSTPDRPASPQYESATTLGRATSPLSGRALSWELHPPKGKVVSWLKRKRLRSAWLRRKFRKSSLQESKAS